MRRQMSMDDDLIARFCSKDDGIFTVGRSCYGGEGCNESWLVRVYYSFDECIKTVSEILYDYEDPDRAIADINPETLCSSKYWHDNSVVATRHFKDGDYKIEVTYGPGCLIKDVNYWGWDKKTRNGDYLNLLSMFFEGLWFDFPTPFKKGDIVHMVYDEHEGSQAFAFCRGAFVLEGIIPRELYEENKELYKQKEENGDKTDMGAHGVFLQEDGTIYRESTHNYMDLEFYHGPYEGMRKLLTPLSSHIKGEIDFELLLYSYRLIVMEQNLKDFKQWSNWFADEKKEMAGLVEDKNNAGCSL